MYKTFYMYQLLNDLRKPNRSQYLGSKRKGDLNIALKIKIKIKTRKFLSEKKLLKQEILHN